MTLTGLVFPYNDNLLKYSYVYVVLIQEFAQFESYSNPVYFILNPEISQTMCGVPCGSYIKHFVIDHYQFSHRNRSYVMNLAEYK